MKKLKLYYLILVVTLTVFLLVSCKVSKNTALPTEAVAPSYRETVPDTSSVGKMPWSTFFSDPELNGLINAAIEHNNDLQIALKEIESADLILKQVKLENLPALDIGAAASTSRPSDNSLNGLSLSAFNFSSKHIEDYTIAASLSWEADIWGKIRSKKAAALAGYLQSSEVRKVVQTRVVTDVAKGYYNLLMLDEELAIAKRNAGLDDSTLNIINLEYQAGQVTSLAVQQAAAQKLAAEELIPQFEQEISIQENAISILSGLNPGAIKRNNQLNGLPVAQTLHVGIPLDLLSRRPDIKIAELDLTKANAEVGFQKANMYPSLSITAQGGLDAIKASNWFNIPASLFGTVVGNLAQPLFEKKKLKTAYDVAKVNREESVIRFRQSVLVAAGDVSDNLVKLEKLDHQRMLVARRVEILQLATKNAQLLFGNGLANYLEVITAQGNVLQSQLELAGVKKDQLDTQLDLYRSVGGGWH